MVVITIAIRRNGSVERADIVQSSGIATLDDVLAYLAFPMEHWTRIYSTNPLERLNRETGESIGRCHPGHKPGGTS